MKNLIKIITGAADREKKWMETPRVIPEQCKALQPGSDDIIMSREFIRSSDKAYREYMVAIRNPRNSHWYMWQVSRFMDRSNTEPSVKLTTSEGVHDPFLVTNLLYLYESSMRNRWDLKNRPVYEEVIDTQESYKAFALRYGIQFTSDGAPYEPNLKDVASKKVILHGDALRKLFGQNAKRQERTAWEHVEKMLHVPMPNLENMRKVQSYALKDAERWCEKIGRNTTNMLFDRELPQWYAENWYPDEMAKIILASAIITYLDQSAKQYATALKDGVAPALRVLNNVDHWIQGPVLTMSKRYFGLKKEQLQHMKDAVVEGRYQGGDLPLQKFIAAYHDSFGYINILKRKR